MKRVDWFVVIFFLVSSLLTLSHLFLPDFYTSHDGIHQVVRLYYFDQSIRDGQIPPRWVGGLLNGFGYPLFLFSYHMPWIIAEPMVFAGFSLFASIKGVFLIGYICSGVFMYLFLRSVYGRYPAFCGAFIYIIAPYRFSNIFVRAAIGDATSFMFLPLLFWGLWNVSTSQANKGKSIIIGAIGLSGVLLSHAMVFLFAILTFGFMIVWMVGYRPKKLLSILGSMLGLVLVGVGMSAYYFIPSLLERHFTKFTGIMSGAFSDSTYVPISRLLYEPWGYGAMMAQEGRMSLQLGIAQWIVVAVASAITIIVLLKRDMNSKRWFGIGMMIVFFLTIYMMSPISSIVWKMIRPIAVIDFTWRILPITVFSSSVVAAYVCSWSKKMWIFAAFIMLIAIYTNRNHRHINEVLSWDIPFYISLEKTTNSFDEYTPTWVQDDVVKKPQPLISENKWTLVNHTSNMISFTVTRDQPGMQKINAIYYPGWHAQVNGREAPIRYESDGRMQIFLPQGLSTVHMKFFDTPLRRFANILSIITFLGVFAYLCKPKKLTLFR